jgi:DNA-binding response OmpR family regulator
MTLLALLVTSDDSATEVLGRVLPVFGIAVERFSDVTAAVERLHQQRFDTLILDFENTEAADELLQKARQLNSGNAPVTVALIADRARARDILRSGSHFILYKPLAEDAVKAGLRAVAALLNRERRRAHRVAVQAPVEIILSDRRKVEGILLDLSETGMEVLTAEPQSNGAFLDFRFEVTDRSLEIQAKGQVAWTKPNGQNGVRFLDLDDAIKSRLQAWLKSAAGEISGPDEIVPHCKLTDLSLGGCYVETESPFPERTLVDLCLKSGQLSVHTEGMVRVSHPGHGMGVEFPSRTAEQRAQVGDLINLLRTCPESAPELSISPRALTADLSQFERSSDGQGHSARQHEDLEDPLLELLRQGSDLQQEDFLSELRLQRSGESVAT